MNGSLLPEARAVKVAKLHAPGEETYYRAYVALMADGGLEFVDAFREGDDEDVVEHAWERDHNRYPPAEAARLIAFIKSLSG